MDKVYSSFLSTNIFNHGGASTLAQGMGDMYIAEGVVHFYICSDLIFKGKGGLVHFLKYFFYFKA